MRIESSIITSLSELRAIEQQRIIEERAAIERRRQAESDARRADEQKLRAEREELMRIEIARAEAEREVRLRVEAAEATERARLQIALDQQRMAEELELRRVEVARKRPTWMLAVTAMACIAAVGLTWFAIDRSNRMAESDHKREVAIAEATQAAQDLKQARTEVEALARTVDGLGDQVTKAEKALLTAQNDADRKKAGEELRAARQRQADARAAKAAADKALWDKQRKDGFKYDPKCAETAVGCLKH